MLRSTEGHMLVSLTNYSQVMLRKIKRAITNRGNAWKWFCSRIVRSKNSGHSDRWDLTANLGDFIRNSIQSDFPLFSKTPTPESPHDSDHDLEQCFLMWVPRLTGGQFNC